MFPFQHQERRKKGKAMLSRLHTRSLPARPLEDDPAFLKEGTFVTFQGKNSQL